ncbi:hypothetical protein BX616_003644 [Lobosporangium transversale]|uniref:Uncharacterized protein n=1 Tax=Lobosporangium transversale TaxID=64571 RepID=A0A1Y2GGB4_9FUNG|nr:hypothetical protein BCR41DRAFT_399340 [Lobosporangium transversale]KAF9898758.1 hypothetical protein BX616_003644 [Lobosporangium transversale]ORZ08268.1 hypothetical protein BCR41DRAFT_399340 [Lobosporangium transversale]|eukprot:XP_021878351.1 hypothetical protein BCR41DRAFT_399340 [Lobosporangium transversale]
MKTFNDYVVNDTHGHSTFEQQYSCFTSYVGKERGNGDKGALHYVLDMAECRAEYQQMLMLGNITSSHVSASSVLRSFTKTEATANAQEPSHVKTKQPANRKRAGERSLSVSSTSTSAISSSSSSSKGCGGSNDSLVEGVKRRRFEKGPASFRPLAEIAHAMHFGIFEPLPESIAVEDDVSPRRQTLCRLSLSYLKKASDTSKQMNPEYNMSLKDAFVSLSGVWSMFCPGANAAFKADYEQGLATCAVKELETVEPGFAAIVTPLVEMAECAAKTDAGVKAQPIISKIYALQGVPGSEPYCRSLDALKTILKHAERPLSGRTKDASEGDAVSLWSAIFREQLPATACLALNLGEQGLAAARQSNLHLFRIFDIIAGTRKCDTILTVEDLEVANFELKKGLCTDVKDDIQLRRTIKAMKSIGMLLKKYGLQCPPVCCMRGMEATVFSIKELDDIWVAGPACDKILLPQTEAEVLDFLKNDMHRLFSLLFLYDRYSKDVIIKKSEYERQIRRGSKTSLLPSPEEESKNKEWDLLVLNTPAKQAGRRKSIVDQLEDDYEEFSPSSPSDRYSTVFNKQNDKINTSPKSQPTPTATNSFIERLTAAVDDDEDTC